MVTAGKQQWKLRNRVLCEEPPQEPSSNNACKVWVLLLPDLGSRTTHCKAGDD